MSVNRGRPVYCRNPTDWDRIRKRAESVGKSTSEFVMTCGLHDDVPVPLTTLALTAERQWEICMKVREMHRLVDMMLYGMPGDGQGLEEGPGLFGAVELLYRLHGGEDALDMLEDPQ